MRLYSLKSPKGAINTVKYIYTYCTYIGVRLGVFEILVSNLLNQLLHRNNMFPIKVHSVYL